MLANLLRSRETKYKRMEMNIFKTKRKINSLYLRINYIISSDNDVGLLVITKIQVNQGSISSSDYITYFPILNYVLITIYESVNCTMRDFGN